MPSSNKFSVLEPLMKRLRSVFVLSLLSVGMSWVMTHSKLAAQTLPLPEQLTPLTSPEGQQLLQDSEGQADFIPLMSQFVTQINQAFCGIASMVMVLNALAVPAPEALEWEREYFTQDNLFNRPLA
jgi:Phytochelatin synthase